MKFHEYIHVTYSLFEHSSQCFSNSLVFFPRYSKNSCKKQKNRGEGKEEKEILNYIHLTERKTVSKEQCRPT